MISYKNYYDIDISSTNNTLIVSTIFYFLFKITRAWYKFGKY